MKIYFTVKRAVKKWLLRTLQPCREIVSLMSESMERRLTLSELLRIRLHLLVCAWCARYLNQIKFMRTLFRGHQARTKELVPSLSPTARERIAKSLKARILKS